ncbi:hypothetical protein BASA81_002302 [Batrachochytrium salamandrivorans]|nr:hypothetical protein BASA81_002302 [Batrachochytrium salamandrivorans]
MDFATECMFFLDSPTSSARTSPPSCVFALPPCPPSSAWEKASAEAQFLLTTDDAIVPLPAQIGQAFELFASASAPAPTLCSNSSSLENSPANSDSEDGEDEDQGEGCCLPSKKKQKLVELTAVDPMTHQALVEDLLETKRANFPAVLAQAMYLFHTAVGGANKSAAAVNALVDAFTNGNKLGRALTARCEELLQLATEDAESTRRLGRDETCTPVTGRKSKSLSLISPETGNLVYQCRANADCNKLYTTAEGLRLHIRNHHEMDKRWACHSPECTSERKFVRQADLRMHLIRMHSPYRPFPCRVPKCSKSFACYSELKRHVGHEEHADIVRLVMNSLPADDDADHHDD